eukprot:scaffold11045_cov51-Isochrysis_galbana.AAC.1
MPLGVVAGLRLDGRHLAQLRLHQLLRWGSPAVHERRHKVLVVRAHLPRRGRVCGGLGFGLGLMDPHGRRGTCA